MECVLKVRVGKDYPMKFARVAITGVIGGVLWIGAADASPIVGLGVPTDAIIGGTVIDFESIATDSLPVTFPSSTAGVDPRVGARTTLSAAGGVTIRGVDTTKGGAAAALYVTPEIVRTQFDLGAFVADGTEQFNYLEYSGLETFNTSANLLTNWEKNDFQNITFQETHANQFVFEFDTVVDSFAFNFGANDGEWVLAAYDGAGLLLEDLDIGIPAITAASDGQYYGIQASGIKYLTLTDTFVVDTGAGIVACDTGAAGAKCGEWVMVDNLTYGRAVVPVPAALPLMLGGLGVLGAVARRRRKA
jgi:hypothetical protein